MTRTVLLLLLALGCGPKRPDPPPVDPRTELQRQQDLANEEGRNQVLEQVRLASLAMAAGQDDLADKTLTGVVQRMQDFRAEGQFRATVGVESAKEWRGEPYEKMMAFLYLAQWRFQRGDYSNALAMTKSAILADTGTSLDQYRADFIPAFVLQALCYDRLRESQNAQRSMDVAVDALWSRAMTDALSETLNAVTLDEQHRPESVDAARVLLLGGLPVALQHHPRDPEQAIRGSLSWATDMRALALTGPKKNWPESFNGLRKGQIRDAFDSLGPLADAWRDASTSLDERVVQQLNDDEAFLRGLLDRPGHLLWIEAGRGPRKVNSGQYGQILTLVPQTRGEFPDIRLDGEPVSAHFVDSVTWQAQTRGGRLVDGFLKGKAVFKDTAGVMGISLLYAGEIAAISSDEGSPLAPILYIAGAALYVGGALTNPRADTREWGMLPDSIYLARIDAPAGPHTLVVNGRTHTLEIPESGQISRWLPRLPPGGPQTIGTATGGSP